MAGFISVVKKISNGVFYMDIPNEIMRKMNLKPFMSCKMTAEKDKITIFDFEKTVKIKVNLDKKTIAIAKKIMKIEGYASLDETISNIIWSFFSKNKTKSQIVYIYPEKYLKSKCLLISDFEKKLKIKGRGKNAKNSF